MKTSIYSVTFNLLNLSLVEKDNILNRYIAIHQKIFDNTDYNKFKRQILATDACNIILRFYSNHKNDDVGFCILYRFHLINENQTTIIFRSDAGLLPEYRHRLLTLSFGLSLILKYKLRHPFVHMIYCESFVHPSSYHLLYKYYPLIYPSIKQTTPTHITSLLKKLRKYFDFTPALSGSDLCAYSGWITIIGDKKLMQEKRRQFEDVDYFHKVNPRFSEGDGLIVIIPIQLGYILHSLLRLIYGRLKKMSKANA